MTDHHSVSIINYLITAQRLDVKLVTTVIQVLHPTHMTEHYQHKQHTWHETNINHSEDSLGLTALVYCVAGDRGTGTLGSYVLRQH